MLNTIDKIETHKSLTSKVTDFLFGKSEEELYIEELYEELKANYADGGYGDH